MKQFSLITALAISFCATLHSQDAKAPGAQSPPAPPREFKPIVEQLDLQDGDSVVFLGDSITHQCLYTQYIEDYYYTRFPNRRIHFHNSGVGGDRASDALLRFDDDVAAFKPKYVTILLGMNDGGYRGYDQGIFDTYQKGMSEILDKIAGLGAVAVPMTPTMHDARASRMKKGAEPRDTYYNGVLALYGAWLEEQTQVRGLGFVDMYSLLNSLTIEQRKKDPKFTMIPDSVHPAQAGQVVMATAILADICPKGPVTQITIREGKAGKYVATAANGKVTDLQAGDGVSFTFQANALPWVLPTNAVSAGVMDVTNGFRMTHAGHHYSNEKITVGNLKPGKYELKIENQLVGTYTEGQLAFGVELEENTRTPEYQQALAIAMLNKERTDKAVHPLRDWWSKLKGKRNAISKAADKDAARADLEKWIAEEFKPGVEHANAAALEFEGRIYQLNQIPARKYELSRVN
jgi:lysophospholipase L1-like esterase